MEMDYPSYEQRQNDRHALKHSLRFRRIHSQQTQDRSVRRMQQEILIKSSLDSSDQPALFYPAQGSHRPLLIGLHTWSFDRFNQCSLAQYAKELDWNLLLPEFRGPNLKTNPNCAQACASEYAMQDILDSIDHVQKLKDIDSDHLFLLGGSGGGHMALMMCAYRPKAFKAVCSFVPITDLEKWAGQNAAYRDHILACCSNSAEEMKKRSPIHYPDRIAQANVKIFHGKFDQSVPVTHSVELYETVFKSHPQARVFLDVFDGGHEIDVPAAIRWFESQMEPSLYTQVTG